ncbi:Putative flippase GtrA (transmembrane translocase of bactoprenol-linked glucose) [Sporobacter termitidis DSM 10068]|uniref:Putative flippase GtrA (Transmembrane translocase of bactoprenol-linked glucose) n=1 Tax=Sporobacter termitidis DSM 10068 TaxID=1123282 RepID=A0A1M5XK70_9FIRM|nr:GtrA family protein [Sporobacter termitidis]SHI00237.1 Putative flippase GtrA (transmembrane translocase of bactoprenol-linked glucose) [Sporobacter termitidis DSM 10068]
MLHFIRSISKKDIRQFLSYIIVGGAATLVEWGLFWCFVYPLKWNQNIALIVAYAISTMANMLLGRLITFRHARVVGGGSSRALNAAKETALIYLVSAVGCGLNLLFLNLFTEVFNMNSMMAKVLVTGMMLIVNFLARKLGIYRESFKPAPGAGADQEH